MSASFDDLSFAKRFRDWARQEIREQIAAVRPRRRTARVASIDAEARRAGVVYVGDPADNVVSVPFNAVVPAAVGQYVQIDGPAGDRAISGVLGADADEARLDATAAANAPLGISPAPGVTETFPMMLRTPQAQAAASLTGSYPMVAPLTVGHSADFEAAFCQLAAPAASGFTLAAGVYSYAVNTPRDEATSGFDLVRLGSGTATIGKGEETLLVPLEAPVTLTQGEQVAVVLLASNAAPPPAVAALEHSAVPLLAVPPYTSAISKKLAATPPDIIHHDDLTTVTDRTVYAGLLH